MKYGQDFVSTLMCFLLSLGCIIGIFQGLMRVARLDEEASVERKYYEVSPKYISMACILGAVWVCGIAWKVDGVTRGMTHIILLSITVSCLVTASVMDIETHLIYNYVWWLGKGIGILMMLLYDNRMWLSMLLFCAMQEYIFSKMYGRADCHGFAVCSMAEAAFGMGMREYLLHMLIAFGIMGVLQLLRGNVGRNGKLKESIPFLPYITVAFGVNLIVYLCV